MKAGTFVVGERDGVQEVFAVLTIFADTVFVAEFGGFDEIGTRGTGLEVDGDGDFVSVEKSRGCLIDVV